MFYSHVNDRDPSVCLDSIKKASANGGGGLDKPVHKTLHTKVSEVYMTAVEELLVNKCGFKFISAKKRYHIKVPICLISNYQLFNFVPPTSIPYQAEINSTLLNSASVSPIGFDFSPFNGSFFLMGSKS
jgi:hypothetical protein